MSEMILRINDDTGSVFIEEIKNGVRSFRQISPDSLFECIDECRVHGAAFSGLLPVTCISYGIFANGDKDICILHSESKADISYYGSVYSDFPLPRMVFGFRVSYEGRVRDCRMGIISDKGMLKPSTKMFRYPFSNVKGFKLCTGNNTFPVVTSLHTMSSLPYYILSMPNNNDHFTPENNRLGYEMRDLLEYLKNKSPESYYNEILVPDVVTLNDFVAVRD